MGINFQNLVVVHLIGLKIEGDRVYKAAIDEQGKKLAVHEVSWYKKIRKVCFEYIPEIYEYEPLCMERIKW